MNFTAAETFVDQANFVWHILIS